MRNIYLIVFVVALSSCGLPPKADPDFHHASRRAHSKKYIVEQTHVTGSRNLFIQPGGMKCLNSSKAVLEYLNLNHRERNKDAVLIFLLDKSNLILNVDELSPEILSMPSAFTLEVTQKAKDRKASSVILVQCLPTRTSKPYKNDREISKNLKLALENINVDLLDHIIMGGNQCFSFADNQLL